MPAFNDNKYLKLGVSFDKAEVHEAVKSLDAGLFPGAFCKIVPDLYDREDYCSIFHSDGAGSKSSLAYMYYKETGDISAFKGIVKDAVVMNIDDILCVGATGNVFLSNTIGRNKSLISGEILKVIIEEYDKISKELTQFGLNTIFSGGETADIGDLVKTLVVDTSVFTSLKRNMVIDASNITINDVIIGVASSGISSYEETYNSGIGSNGLTLARHGTLSHEYYDKYPECFDNALDKKHIFFGKHLLSDKLDNLKVDLGTALLSPTRTYTPIIIAVLEKYRKAINGIIHNTGGGQTKDLHFGMGIKYVKNSLFKVPPIFEIIQESSNTDWKEMFKVFNMGHRMEIFCDEGMSKEIINISKKFNVEAKIVGYCESSSNRNKNEVEIISDLGTFHYN